MTIRSYVTILVVIVSIEPLSSQDTIQAPIPLSLSIDESSFWSNSLNESLIVETNQVSLGVFPNFPSHSKAVADGSCQDFPNVSTATACGSFTVPEGQGFCSFARNWWVTGFFCGSGYTASVTLQDETGNTIEGLADFIFAIDEGQTYTYCVTISGNLPTCEIVQVCPTGALMRKRYIFKHERHVIERINNNGLYAINSGFSTFDTYG